MKILFVSRFCSCKLDINSCFCFVFRIALCVEELEHDNLGSDPKSFRIF